MIALIQRVSSAKVKSKETNKENKIGLGMCVLLGVGQQDTENDLEKITKKITNLRIFKDNNKKMNLGPKEAGVEILLISQFTLLANSKKGNRPSFIKAAKPKLAKPLDEEVENILEQNEITVKTGVFGAMMRVEIQNDGPVTIILKRD